MYALNSQKYDDLKMFVRVRPHLVCIPGLNENDFIDGIVTPLVPQHTHTTQYYTHTHSSKPGLSAVVFSVAPPMLPPYPLILPYGGSCSIGLGSLRAVVSMKKKKKKKND